MLNDSLKLLLKDYKSQIELMQCSVIGGIASIMYSEYISCIQQKDVPVRRILVPWIRELREYTDINTEFMNKFSDSMLFISEEPLMQKYKDEEIFSIFKYDWKDNLDLVLRLYVIPNAARTIPNMISKKFGLDDEKQQLIQENRDIVMFRKEKFTIDDAVVFALKQTMFNMLFMCPNIKSYRGIIASNKSITWKTTDDTFIAINNSQALCPIFYHKDIINGNIEVLNLINFVTSTAFDEVTDESVKFHTGPLNHSVFVKLK